MCFCFWWRRRKAAKTIYSLIAEFRNNNSLADEIVNRAYYTYFHLLDLTADENPTQFLDLLIKNVTTMHRLEMLIIYIAPEKITPKIIRFAKIYNINVREISLYQYVDSRIAGTAINVESILIEAISHKHLSAYAYKVSVDIRENIELHLSEQNYLELLRNHREIFNRLESRFVKF